MRKVTAFILFLLISLRSTVYGQQPVSESAFHYLIVTPDNDGIRQWADTLARFRNEQGIFTKVVSLNEIGENLPLTLRNYFKDYFKDDKTTSQQDNKYNDAVLLFGDYDKDPAKGITSFYLNDHPDGHSYLADNKLVDFDNDDLPDMCIARMPASDAQQAELMVRKTIRYEREPSTNPDYYNHPVTAMGYEESRWFQLCSEVIAGYFEKTGKNPNRLNAIYSGTPDSVWSTGDNTNIIINYFGSKGLDYIPDNLKHLTDWNAGQNDLSDAINEGTFLIQHRDHGEYQAWKNPYFSNKEINDLSNNDLTFIMSVNCQTGNFCYGEGDNDCFAERFLRTENGAVAVIAASQISYSYVNDTYVWGFYDYLWNDFLPDYGSNDIDFKYPAFANVYGKHFLKKSSWPYLATNKKVTYNLFHYFGDAFLQLNTEMPKEIELSYPEEILTDCSSFTIKKDNKTRVAFSVDGDIIATSFGEDSIINIKPFYKEGKIKIVATKQDHYRHEGYIYVKSHLDNDDLNIYPNPTKDILFVESKGIKKIEIYNSFGQKLMDFNNNVSKEKLAIDCRTLNQGAFLLNIIYEDKKVSRTFIVH